MAIDGRFYPSPDPTQGRRFVPIPQQGNNPPICNAALGLALILASWPSPFDYQPQQKIPYAPIPAQGNQPSPADSDLAINMTVACASWQTSLEYQPYQRYTTAPIPAQGNLPPPHTVVSLFDILNSWIPPDPQPRQLPLTIAPLTLVYGQQPPVFNDALELENVCASWPSPFDYQPYQRYITVPIPAQGDQPPLFKAQQPVWLSADYPQQQLPGIAAILSLPVPPLVSQPFTSLPANIIASWIAADQLPQRLPTVPIPAQGQQPPLTGCDLSTNTAIVLANWPAPFDYQPQQKILYAPIPSIVQTPIYSTVALNAVMASWIPPDPQPQQKILYAPIPAQGNQPPVLNAALEIANYSVNWPVWEYQPYQRYITAPIPAQGDKPPNVNYGQAISQWYNQPFVLPQTSKSVAAILVRVDQPPPLSPIVLNGVLSAWIPPEPQPQQKIRYAPIVAHGSQPTPRSNYNAAVWQWWSQPDPMPQSPTQSAAITVQVTIPANFVKYITYLDGLVTFTESAPAAWIVSVPASATSSGRTGQVAYDATHFYVCISTNTWVRTTLATW